MVLITKEVWREGSSDTGKYVQRVKEERGVVVRRAFLGGKSPRKILFLAENETR